MLGVVVVTLLVGAAPAIARGSGGGGDRDQGRGRSDRVEEPKDANEEEPKPDKDGKTSPAVDQPGEHGAAPATPVAARSFIALPVLLAAVLAFLAVHGRLDRRDPKRADLPGEFRRFR